MFCFATAAYFICIFYTFNIVKGTANVSNKHSCQGKIRGLFHAKFASTGQVSRQNLLLNEHPTFLYTTKMIVKLLKMRSEKLAWRYGASSIIFLATALCIGTTLINLHALQVNL
jgi:hypothetical protein